MLIKTVLSLCDYSGVWSQPYADTGYNVIRVDLQTSEQDVRLVEFPGPVHGILAAHPHHHGDPYMKHTYLWGRFTEPLRSPVEPEQYPDHLPKGRRDWTSRQSSSHRNQRSETPARPRKAAA